MEVEINIENQDRKKRNKLIYSLIFIVLFFGIVLLYSRYIATSGLIVKEYKIVNNKVPDSFDGIKVIHFSDLHYGRTTFEKQLKEIVDKINYIKPDIVVFTGDLIDKDTIVTDEMKNIIISELNKIESKLGKYIIVGNHDYFKPYFYELVEETNFTFLRNDYDIIYNGSSEFIYLGGVDNAIYGEMDIEKTLEYFMDENKVINTNNDIFKILLIHEPDYINKIVENYNIDVVLAGHSHNGQFRLPIIGAIFLPNGAKKNYLPYYNINNTDVFISSGIGTSYINLRLFNKPSINFYRIVKH